MTRVRALFPLVLAVCAACAREEVARPSAPHVVVLVADDLGWGEVAAFGGALPTPNLDRLAAEGVALERMHAHPICSATRAALLTGRDPIRMGLARAVITPWRDFGLPSEEVTLAEALRDAGYARRGAFGKWHLGHLARRWHPLGQGFTTFRGHYNGAIDHFTHEREGEFDWHLDHAALAEPGYATRLEAAAAAEFLARHADEGPLLCYVGFSALHAPFQAPAETLARFAHLAEADGSVGVRQARAAMLAELDDAVGVVLDALDDAGIARDTLVWFVGDNGAGPEQLDANAPLRGHKGTLYDGALRVPAFVRWPAVLPAGARVGDPVAVTDVFATSLAAAGVEVGPGLDGVSLLDALRGRGSAPGRELGFYYGQDGPGDEQVALRTPAWKLVVRGPDLSAAEPGAAHAIELFDMVRDPEERVDVSARHPDVVRTLLARARAYRALQPVDAVAPYWEGYEGFVPPKDWTIPDD